MPRDPVLRIVDAEAGGDVSRVIIGGAPELDGASVAEQCADFARRHDRLRLKLIQPPHGALHMCPVLVLPPRSNHADFGVIIMESMGYPPISGSNLFCATAVALQYGFAERREPETRLKVETPAGIVAITAWCRDGACGSVEFENSPACVRSAASIVVGPSGEPVDVTLISAGVEYALAGTGALGVALTPECNDALIETGCRIASAAGTDFVLFHDALEQRDSGGSCRVAVFQKPGVVCRGPTGTGTSAMLTLAHARGVIGTGDRLAAHSPSGSVFIGRILAVRDAPEGPVLYTAVRGEVRIQRQLIIS